MRALIVALLTLACIGGPPLSCCAHRPADKTDTIAEAAKQTDPGD